MVILDDTMVMRRKTEVLYEFDEFHIRLCQLTLFAMSSLEFQISEFNPGLEGVLTAGCPCATAASKSKQSQAPSKAPT